MKKTMLDMTTGPALPLLVSFTLPSLAGTLLNQVYSITDSIIVGQCVGQTALAAIGCAMPIVMLLAAFTVGLNVGVGILLSQCFGSKDMAAMRRTFANSLYLGAFLALALAVLGLPLTRPILHLMGTPAGPLEGAADYLQVNFLTSCCPIFYFLFSCAFRGMGDSTTALYCLILSVVANIGLDLWFVAVLDWGIAGSAWATALAQALSVVFSVYMLWRKYPDMRLKKADFAPDKALFVRIAKLATPIALQTAFNNLGNVVVQSAINGFGEAVMAAYTAASRLGMLALMPVETVGSSLSVYAGQNYGAKKHHRIRLGVRAAWQLDLLVSTVLGAVLLVFGGRMTTLFLENPSTEVLDTAARFLLITAVPGILCGIMQIYQQTLRGVGFASQAVTGGLMQLGAKVAVAALGAWVFHSLDAVWLAWPISFIAGTVYPWLVYRRHFGHAVPPPED